VIGIFTSMGPTVLRSGTRVMPSVIGLCDTGCNGSISVVCIIAILVQFRSAFASERGL